VERNNHVKVYYVARWTVFRLNFSSQRAPRCSNLVTNFFESYRAVVFPSETKSFKIQTVSYSQCYDPNSLVPLCFVLVQYHITAEKKKQTKANLPVTR